jgi:multidrug efflux pump subunit AcrA (membrane-fusion protein)
MTARVELLVDKMGNALYIPLESVFERGGRRFCWVLRDGEPQVQEVLVGPSNENHIVIEAGLESGERVLLQNPTETARPAGGEALPEFLDVVSPVDVESPSPESP